MEGNIFNWSSNSFNHSVGNDTNHQSYFVGSYWRFIVFIINLLSKRIKNIQLSLVGPLSSKSIQLKRFWYIGNTCRRSPSNMKHKMAIPFAAKEVEIGAVFERFLIVNQKLFLKIKPSIDFCFLKNLLPEQILVLPISGFC